MKTAAKHVVPGLRLLALSLVLLPAAAFAADPVVAEMPPVVAAAQAPAAPMGGPARMAMPAADEEKDAKDEDAHSPKIPDSVKGVIKHLSNATADITLDDLNAAREAVAKLDALIDIEKRLKDLQNLRREREEKSVANAIPASAFNMPRGMPLPLPMAMPSAAPAAAPPGSVDVVQIAGSNGRYSATVKEFGTSRLVRVGDKLADGSVVRNVTSEGVEVEQGKSEHLIRIKGAGTVASESP